MGSRIPGPKIRIAFLAMIVLAGLQGAHAASAPPYTGDDPDIHISFEPVAGVTVDAFCSPFPYNLGSLIAGTAKTITFKIWNAGTGTAPLNLTGPAGAPVEIIDDSSSGRFAISEYPSAASLAPSPTAYLQFKLAFTDSPASASRNVYSCKIRIPTNDPDEAEYLIPVTIRVTPDADPELVLLLSSSYIPNGSGAEAARGSFDFGGRHTGSSLTKVFTIANAGTKDLTISGITKDTEAFGSISFPSPFSGTIHPNASSNFSISYQSSSPETASQTIKISSDDPDYPSPNYFRFMVNGTSTAGYLAKINLTQGCRWIPFDSQYAAANIDFGDVYMPDPAAAHSGFMRYIIDVKNTGLDNLTATASTSSDIAGTGAAGFGITDIPSMTVVPGGSQPFVLTFEPPHIGPFSASITVHSTYTDSTIHDITFTASGTGLAPDIKVHDASHGLVPSSTSAIAVSFPDTRATKESDWQALHILNTGNSRLAITEVSLDDNLNFKLSGPTPAPSASSPLYLDPVDAGETNVAPFSVRFTPQTASPPATPMTAFVTIKCNDPDAGEATYKLKLSGSGFLPPVAAISVPAGPAVHQSGSTYYVKAPCRLSLTPTYADDNATTPTIHWTIDDSTSGASSVTTIDGSPGALAAQDIDFSSPGIKTITVIGHSSDGHDSDPTTITVDAYTNESLNFPYYRGVPFDEIPPVIDGYVWGPDSHPDAIISGTAVSYGENGYQGAYEIPFNDGTTNDVTVRLIRSSTALYFGIDVGDDSDFSDADRIYIGIGQNDSDARFDRSKTGYFEIIPHSDAVTAYKGSAAGTYSAAAVSGIEKAHQANPNGTVNHWSFEIKVPIDAGDPASFLHLGTKFLVCVRVLRAGSAGEYVPFCWPKQVPLAIVSPEQNPEWWGSASQAWGVAGNGIYIRDSGEIGVQTGASGADPLSSVFTYNEPAPGADSTISNKVVARVSNEYRVDSLDPATGLPTSAYQEVTGAKVTFRVANWGIVPADEAYWIPITGGEKVPIASISAETGGVPGSGIASFDWALSHADIERIRAGSTAISGLDRKHQCILAEIETEGISPAGVNVTQRSVCRNMDFDSAQQGDPHFSAPAEISARGLDAFIADLKLKNSGERKILIKVFTREWSTSQADIKKIETKRAIAKEKTLRLYSSSKVALKPGARLPLPAEKPIPAERYLPELKKYIKEAPKTISFMEYVVKAYVYTGRDTTLNGRKYAEVAAIGSYGYVVRHYSGVDAWSFHIDGAQKLDANSYLITIPKDGKATITDNVRAYDPPFLSFGALGGLSCGITNPGKFSSAGGGGMGMVAFMNFQLAGGYDSIPLGGGSGDWKTASLALSLRYATPLLFDIVAPYGSFGLGVYQDGESKTRWGIAFGAGLEFAVSHPVHIQVGVDTIATKMADYSLAHLNAGLIYRLTR